MVREIVIYGDPVLREKCKPVTEVTEEIHTLVTDMLETMVAAEGVGLAAPQVGVALQLAVIDVAFDPECISYLRVNGEDARLDDWMPLIFTNPVLEREGTRMPETEGCLSFPEIKAEITRPEEVVARFTTLEGEEVVLESDGLLARAIQHETDHLNGILFIDRMSAASKVGLKRRIKEMQAEFGQA